MQAASIAASSFALPPAPIRDESRDELVVPERVFAGLCGTIGHRVTLSNDAKTPGFLEREKGFEPSTSTLARWHSTTELLPQNEPPF